MKPTYEHTVYITGQLLMPSCMVCILPYDDKGCQNIQEDTGICTAVHTGCVYVDFIN